MIRAIILAAGQSRRFGDDKRKSKLSESRSLLETTILNTRKMLPDLLVVLRADDQDFQRALKASIGEDDIEYFCAPDSAQGMAHSLSNAVQQLKDTGAILVFLGDMPFIQKSTIDALLEKRTEVNGPCILVPTFNGKRGHPVLFTSDYFAEITALTGDTGAKPVMDKHANEVVLVEVPDPGILKDIDRPEDLTDQTEDIESRN